MFPNPQDALPLPSRPSLERYRKIAKELVRVCKSGQPESLRAWAEQWVHGLIQLSGIEITPQLPVRIRKWVDEVESFARRQLFRDGDERGERRCVLTDAQFVLARSHGFESWPKFVDHLEALAHEGSGDSHFEVGADALVRGDVGMLKRLLSEEPTLIHARSKREHGATLLHYVSANGVEGYRQKTPQNIVEIAEILLRAGAEVDATADVYGGGCTALGLAATSVHPERAGMQEALLEKLLEYGAEMDRISIAGNGQSMVMACFANGRPRAAAYLAGRGARCGFVETAALGQLDKVKSFFDAGGDSQPGLVASQMVAAFLYACQFGQADVAAFLIQQGADVGARDRDGQTGLHHAVIGGELETVRLMLKYTELLEVVNGYGGTPAGQALWSAAHDDDPDRYIPILEALTEAGAKLSERHAAISPRVDAWLEERGCRVERDWSW